MKLPQFAAIVGTQRSGTTVLRSVIGTNPGVKTYGEVFIPKDFDQKGGYYKYLYERVSTHPQLCVPTTRNIDGLFGGYLNYLRRISEDPDIILFDCKYEFMRGALVPGALRSDNELPMLRLMQNHDFKIIHLVRENVLAMRVSALLSTRTRVWATDNPEAIKDRTVVVPTGNLLNLLHESRREQRHWQRALQGRALCLSYEKLFEDGEVVPGVLQAVASHLGVENDFVARPKYRKIGLPLKEAIRNFDEVARVLRGSTYERFLET